MPVEEAAKIRPDYVTVYPHHPGYGLIVRIHNLETELVRVTKECAEWKEAYENLVDISSVCEFAIERSDIDLLQMLIEDDEVAVAEWRKWRANAEN